MTGITISITDPSSAKITKKLAALAEQVRHLGKPNNPFLDKRYSMNMPSSDFTPWLMQRIAENDWRPFMICYPTFILTNAQSLR